MINVLLSSYRLRRKLQTSAIIMSAQNKTTGRRLLIGQQTAIFMSDSCC